MPELRCFMYVLFYIVLFRLAHKRVYSAQTAHKKICTGAGSDLLKIRSECPQTVSAINGELYQ
jgi:hypothetical protein